MKSSNLLSTAILLVGFSSGFGQTEQSKVKRISIQEIYIQTGLFSERNASGTLKDFQSLAPQSILLKKDFTGYSSSQGVSLTSNTMFSILVGIKFSDKQKTTYKANPMVRVGLSYFSGSTLIGSLNKEDRKRYDTLTSAQTGQTIFSDSVSSKSTGMNYSFEQLRFDGSVIFRTNPEARWSLFTGIGITAGLSINAHTEIYDSKSDRTETPYSNGNNSFSYNSYGGEWRTEKFRNKNNFGLSTYIPMGVDFRIGKKREFWKRTHLFYELRPGINMTSIPELRTVANASVQHGLGLKVSW